LISIKRALGLHESARTRQGGRTAVWRIHPGGYINERRGLAKVHSSANNDDAFQVVPNFARPHPSAWDWL